MERKIPLPKGAGRDGAAPPETGVNEPRGPRLSEERRTYLEESSRRSVKTAGNEGEEVVTATGDGKQVRPEKILRKTLTQRKLPPHGRRGQGGRRGRPGQKRNDRPSRAARTNNDAKRRTGNGNRKRDASARNGNKPREELEELGTVDVAEIFKKGKERLKEERLNRRLQAL